MRMIKQLTLSMLALAVTGLVPAVAMPQAAPAEREVRIPFSSTIRDFRADGTSAVYLRAGSHWYRGTFQSTCRELPWAEGIQLDRSSGTTGIDRFSTLLVRGQRCQLTSLVKVDGPPAKKDRAKRD